MLFFYWLATFLYLAWILGHSLHFNRHLNNFTHEIIFVYWQKSTLDYEGYKKDASCETAWILLIKFNGMHSFLFSWKNDKLCWDINQQLAYWPPRHKAGIQAPGQNILNKNNFKVFFNIVLSTVFWQKLKQLKIKVKINCNTNWS